MRQADEQRLDRGALVYRHHERLYRLALLASGDAKTAAALAEAAYRQLSPDLHPEAVEGALARALLGGRPSRRRWAFQPADLSHTTLDRAGANALLGVLAGFTPAERLVAGLAYIGGHTPAEIDALLGPGAHDPAAALASLRMGAARALGLVPAEAGLAELERIERWAEGQLSDDEQLALRRDLLADPVLRATRDGMLGVRELLPRAVPALFSAMPSLALTEKLLRLTQRAPAARRTRGTARRAQLGLAAGVLLLAAAIVAVPSWLASRAAAPAASQRSVPASPAELLAAAIHRFDQAPLTAGVLHEVYEVSPVVQPGLRIERWYDYAPPHRLAIQVTEVGPDARPLLQISSDGRSMVQFRYGRGSDFGQAPSDVQLSQAEAQAIIPLLRGQPQAVGFGRDEGEPGDLGPLFLAQARDAGATLLGQTTLLGRPAMLLTYQSAEPPGQAPGPAPSQVILTIDSQTYALLDVAVLAPGESESTALRPVRAQLLEVLETAPAEAPFTLPGGPGVAQQIGMGSVRFPFIRGEARLTLDAAAQREPNRLLAPLQLPAANMRGLAFENGNGTDQSDVVLLYEGEFQDVLLLQSFRTRGTQDLGEEQTAGEFRYRILGDGGLSGGLVAMVYRPDAPADPLGLVLNDTLSTEAERQARLATLIGSLTPVNDQSLPLLRPAFQLSDSAAGHSQ